MKSFIIQSANSKTKTHGIPKNVDIQRNEDLSPNVLLAVRENAFTKLAKNRRRHGDYKSTGGLMTVRSQGCFGLTREMLFKRLKIILLEQAPFQLSPGRDRIASIQPWTSFFFFFNDYATVLDRDGVGRKHEENSRMDSN